MLIAAGVVQAFVLFLALDFATSVYADGAVYLSIAIAAIAGLALPFLFGALSYKKSEDPLRVLINILEPKTGVIKEVLAELGETPALSIYTESKWFERPVLELPPDVVKFFAQFDTEIILDINY
ncbi:MAG TPA: hypothetical protein DIT84_06695 [Clostridiales bacterium]|nr:hypothetical protein [Clostridiales bacterium]